MKNTRTGGYLRQLLHLIGKFIEDKQNGKRFTITGGKITNYQKYKKNETQPQNFSNIFYRIPLDYGIEESIYRCN